MFVGNHSEKEGGAIHACAHNCDLKLINCTFAANTARLLCGGICNGGEGKTTLTNCIVWANADRAGTGETSQLKFKYLIASHACVQGVSEPPKGLGMFGEDPLFAQLPDDGGDGWGDNPKTPDIDEGANDYFGDLRLTAGSACIDAGTEEPPQLAGPIDLDANNRIIGPRIDVGALEFQADKCAGTYRGPLSRQCFLDLIQ